VFLFGFDPHQKPGKRLEKSFFARGIFAGENVAF
jgi:hypothetical protein